MCRLESVFSIIVNNDLHIEFHRDLKYQYRSLVILQQIIHDTNRIKERPAYLLEKVNLNRTTIYYTILKKIILLNMPGY